GAHNVITAQLYAATGSTCEAGSGETDGMNNGVVCGPNPHSVSDPSGLIKALFGAAHPANGTDFTTDQLPADRGDSVTIPQDVLNALIVNGDITLFLWPDPGQSRSAGVADVKYVSATLTYQVAPAPSTLILLVLGLVFLWPLRGLTPATR